MKTYKDFKEFVEQPKYMGVVWQCVLYDATNAGFKKWHVWLYARIYRRTYMFHIKPILKKFANCVGIYSYVLGCLSLLWMCVDL